MNLGAFLMRGLEKVRAEFSLTALAYQERVQNLVGKEPAPQRHPVDPTLPALRRISRSD
jgi:hypothetical protein